MLNHNVVACDSTDTNILHTYHQSIINVINDSKKAANMGVC